MSVLQSNEFLFHLSKAYGITKRIRAAESAYSGLIEQVVTGGAMFEAHIDECFLG
jgi:hypothetical protein